MAIGANRSQNFNLEFRRHLALCLAVALLASELEHLIKSGARQLQPRRTNDEAPLTGHRQQNDLNGAASTAAYYGNSRFRLAHAVEYQPRGAAFMGPDYMTFSRQPISGAGQSLHIDEQMAKQQQQTASNGRLNDDNDDEFNIISFVLAYIDYYLPVLNLNYTLNPYERFPTAQLDIDVENYYEERYPANTTLEQLQLLAVKAALRFAPMPLHTSWGYESRDEMQLSSLPVQDDQRCAAHLRQLSQRLDKITGSSQAIATINSPSAEGGLNGNQLVKHRATPVENLEAQQLFKSQDLQMLRYLDTFGHVPSDLLRGNVKWYGSYSGCLDTKLKANIQDGGTRRMKFRYCMASIKSLAWPVGASGSSGNKWDSPPQTLWHFGPHTIDAKLSNYFMRIGLCLPESCDSSAFNSSNQNAEAIEKLLKFNLLKPFNSDHYYISDLYCLPDHRSPLRTVPILGKLLILATLGWLSLIGIATIVHLNVERFYTKAVRDIRRKQKMEELRRNYEQNGANQADEEQRVAISAASMKEREAASELQANEYKESDIFHIRAYWIRLNVYLWDKLTGGLWPGIDYIACLSLYSNWLKYTKRLKLAVAQLHADEQRRERIKSRNLQLFESMRGKSSVTGSSRGKSAGNIQPQATTSSITSATDDHQQPPTATRSESLADEQAFDRELTRRLMARDEFDEMKSDTFKRRVDTSSLNALKVIALVWIIAGHCIFYLASTISDGAILKLYVRDLAAFALANGAMYITELFFVITGCLTAYLAFKFNTYQIETPADEEETEIVSQQQQQENLPSPQKRGASLSPSATSSVAVKPLNAHSYLESRIFKPQFWFMIVVNRYLRILPTYLLCYAFVKLVSVYIGGSGPTWDYAVSPNSMRRACVQESWLPVLTLTTNFVDIYQHCIVGGWYLSTDMQFMVMAVPLLIMLALCQRRINYKQGHHSIVMSQQQVSYSQKQQQLTFIRGGNNSSAAATTSAGQVNNSPQSPSASPDNLMPHSVQLNNHQYTAKNQVKVGKRLIGGYAIIVLLALTSALASIIYGILYSEIDASYIIKFVPHTVAILSQNIAMYTNSIFRFRAFAFGMILGHLLYLHEFDLIKLPKLIQLHGSKITSIVAGIGFGIMFLPVLYPKGKIILSHDIMSIAMVLTAGGTDIFLCILIFLVCIGKAPKGALFLLNSPFWSVLSSLSLCAFLVHTEVIVLLTSQLMPLPKASYTLLFLVFSATVMLTYGLALALHLTFEMPVARLTKGLMSKFVGVVHAIGSKKNGHHHSGGK